MYLRTPDNHDAGTSESSLRSQMWSPACVEHIPARVSLTITSLYHPRTMRRVALQGRSPCLRYGLRSLPRTGEVKRVLHSKLDLGQTSRQESFARVPETRRALLHLHLECQNYEKVEYNLNIITLQSDPPKRSRYRDDTHVLVYL